MSRTSLRRQTLLAAATTVTMVLMTVIGDDLVGLRRRLPGGTNVRRDVRDAHRYRAGDRRHGSLVARPACVSVAVVFETHSTSVDNELGIATGWNQGELSEIGREQARELGDRRRDDGIAVVFTSDLRRAVQTAELAFAGSPLPIVRDRRLRECDYGALNGMPRARLDAERRRRLDEPFPAGESWRQAVERVTGFLSELPRSQRRAAGSHHRPRRDEVGARPCRARCLAR